MSTMLCLYIGRLPARDGAVMSTTHQRRFIDAVPCGSVLFALLCCFFLLSALCYCFRPYVAILGGGGTLWKWIFIFDVPDKIAKSLLDRAICVHVKPHKFVNVTW